jgi:hypothetical protein
MDQMKWIELIRVRSSVAALQEAMPSLQKHINEIEEATNGAETFFMQHAIYNGDLAVVVVWMNGMKPDQTREGLMIAERLQELGSIDHAVWVPADNGVKDRP